MRLAAFRFLYFLLFFLLFLLPLPLAGEGRGEGYAAVTFAMLAAGARNARVSGSFFPYAVPD
jgi:hypothetical protein